VRVDQLMRYAMGRVGSDSVIVESDPEAVTRLGVVSGLQEGLRDPVAEVPRESGFDLTPVVEADLVSDVVHRGRPQHVRKVHRL